jgi:hypothetical protein
VHYRTVRLPERVTSTLSIGLSTRLPFRRGRDARGIWTPLCPPQRAAPMASRVRSDPIEARSAPTRTVVPDPQPNVDRVDLQTIRAWALVLGVGRDEIDCQGRTISVHRRTGKSKDEWCVNVPFPRTTKKLGQSSALVAAVAIDGNTKWTETRSNALPSFPALCEFA